MLSRRRFLVATAGTVALAACGGGRGPGKEQASYSLARVFAPEQPAGTPLRLPLALADAQGVLLDDVPAELRVRTGPVDGDLGDAVTVERHDDGVPRAYFPLAATFGEPGEWRIVADTGDGTAEQVVSIRPAQQLPAVPNVGDPMVSLATPTTADGRGVDPICTRDPVCPLHDVSLDEALAAGRPMALLVSTPRFCQTAICGPVLDLLLDADTDRTLVHAEVYVDERARQTAPVVDAYGLTFEPALFVADAAGTVTARLDYTFDRRELAEALS